MASDRSASGSDRLETIEQMAAEYERGAEERGQDVNAANYRNIRTAIENLREDVEDERRLPRVCVECGTRWLTGSKCILCGGEVVADD